MIQVERLQLHHVRDFLQWGVHEDPLLKIYNFEEKESTLEDWYRWKTGGKMDVYFAILLDGLAIGYMGLKDIKKIARRGTLGIILDKNHMNQGLGTEAITWLMNYAFYKMHLNRVDLEVLPWNQLGIHIYKKLGFQTVGRHRVRAVVPLVIDGVVLEEERPHFVEVIQMRLSKDRWSERIEI